MKSVPTKENLMLYDDDDRSAEEALTEPDTDALDAGEQEGAGSLPALPSLALGGATLLTIGGFDVLAHLGPTGWLVGGIAAIIAARHGGAMLEQAKMWLTPTSLSDDESDQDAPRHLPARASRSLLDRALGRFPDPAADEPDEDEAANEPAPSRRNAWQPVNAARHPECLHLGAVLHPHADTMLSRRIGVFGIPGSGKSNALTVFCEELGKLDGIGDPFVLADTEGEYPSLCSRKYLMRPVAAHAGNLTPEDAFPFGQQVLEQGWQVVLDLQSYESDDLAALVMIEVIARMRAWAEARPNDERATCMFLLDEAAIWLPQRENESSLSKERDAQGLTLLARLQQAFFSTVVRRGRKRGIGFLFATQRPADLDKRCIACDWLFLFRQTFPNDLAKYAELGVPKDVAQALSAGEAWVIDPSGKQGVYQFRQRYSPDTAQSPGLASLRQHTAHWQQTAGSGLPLMPELPTRDVPVMATQKATPKLPALYQQALEVYEPGMTYRELGEVLGVGKDKAGIILQTLKKRGLLPCDEEPEDDA
jgi:hypothetical protein